MKTLLKTLFSILFVLALIAGTNHASAQFNSGLFQGAKSSGKGNAEMTAHYSSFGAAYEGESRKILNNFGIQSGFGITNLTEIRVRYDRLNFSDSDGFGINTLSFGPKFSTQSGKFAIYLPLGFNFGDDVEQNWSTEPTFIFSIPLGETISLNLTPSYLISLEEGNGIDEGLLKLNLGFGVNLGSDWILRPEGGLQYFVSSFDGNYYHFGLGISGRIGKKE